MSDDLRERAFEAFRAKTFGAYSKFPVDAYTYFMAGYRAAVEAEREACAALCDEDDYIDGPGFARAIRARKP